MKTMWIEPDAIEDVWVVNNRKENPGHIESLAESMRQNGYLRKYPVIVFKAANIPVETDKPYLMACGHHRRKAAIAAGIENIFAEVHDGTEEEWIEMMSLDNFQFDVASNPGIGLAFTEQERRSACTQLLLLPKYLRKTSVSLANSWKVSEGTVRRWRKEAESLIDEGMSAVQALGVSPERFERLKEVMSSAHRENEAGETVAVRQKPKELTNEERFELWQEIKTAALFDQRSDGIRYLDRNGFQFETFRAYVCQRYNIQDSDIPHQLTRGKLQNIYNWIAGEDPEVIARCKELQHERDALSQARKNCSDYHDKVIRAFDENLSPTPGNTFSSAHIASLKAFKKVVKQRFDGFDFDARHDATTCDQLMVVQQTFFDICADIEMKEEWVLTFKTKFSDKARQDRKALEQAWSDARKEMFTALSEYPRDVSKVAFYNGFDKRFGHPSGRTREFTEPTPAITDETLTADIRHFKDATRDIRSDTDWMQAMPEPLRIIDALRLTERITELHIKVEGGGREIRIAEFDAETAAEWISAELQEQLIKIADRFIYSDNRFTDS
ncbi:MAG: ParB N-terminal domain-containing protein [Candidatus Poribacteria bacterium]|nr:ParB N-terminal domain-containing protein [Candidatus Poribacteria bacterium]